MDEKDSPCLSSLHPSEEEEEEEEERKKENHFGHLATFRFGTFTMLFHATGHVVHHENS